MWDVSNHILLYKLHSRCFHSFDLYITWWQDKAYAFLSIGMLVSLAFSIFSYLCCVKPFYKSFVKFLHVSAVHDTLPTDVTPEKRRASVVKLDQAVAELLDGDGMMELADIVESLFVKRRTSRRQSMPMLSRKRRSLVMLHSKSFGGGVFEKSKKDL